MSVQTLPTGTVERRPPRRRLRRKSVWRRIAWPAAKYSAVAATIFMLGQIVAGNVARPLKLLRSESRESRLIAAEIESLRKQNAALERQLAYLKTRRGMAQAARKLGYVKPGEILLVLPAESPGPAGKKPRQ
ncbi:MAG: FtsB family cell division protein [Armatimonadota bacterium]